MNMISTIANARCEARVNELQAEFGPILAERILEAEAVDFLWDARLKERYLGQHIEEGLSSEDPVQELSSVAVLSFLAGRWLVGMCLVDGEGSAVDLVWKRELGGHADAEIAFVQAR